MKSVVNLDGKASRWIEALPEFELMQPREKALNETAAGRHHSYPLACAFHQSNPAENSVERNRCVIVRSRVAASDDAAFGRSAFQPDYAMYDRGVKPAVIEHDVTLLDGLVVVEGFDSDHVAVLDGGTHTASAHAQLDRQAAGQQLISLLEKVGRL
jgi:hypothetical protein